MAFGDDFFTNALSRAQGPLGEFLQTATPSTGHVDLGGPPQTGHVDLGFGQPFGHVDFGTGSYGGANVDWGASDFLRPLQLIQQGMAKAQSQVAAQKQAQEQAQQRVQQNVVGPGEPPKVQGGVIPAKGLEGISLANLGPQQRDEFLTRAMALGQALEKETGIPAEVFAAMAANESNFGNAPGNIMGGVKPADRNDPNAIWLDTWEMENGQRVQRREPFVASRTALEGMQKVAQTLQSGRYAQAYEQLRAGQITPETFLWNVNRAGYATNPNWATGEIIPLMREAAQHREAGAALLNQVQNDQITRDSAVAMTVAPQGVSQYDLGLPKSVADAFCGPAAAVAFANTYGRQPTAIEAMNLAKEVGWNQGQGMAGPQSEVNLLNRMGVPARLAAPDPRTIQNEVEQGRPVIIDTPGHYFQIIGYNPQTGGFIMGDAVGRRAGQNGIRLENLGSLGFGPARTAILANMAYPEDVQRD